ncbi:MAG: DUF6051 family protein [Deltaproteobacteria bacterium]|jgi:hypothetical protein|nr:DUF6051 family protein [Deltaproteobacteria bacterium]
MTHLQLHNQLKDAFSLGPPEIPLFDDLTLRNYDFVSNGTKFSGPPPGAPPPDLTERLPQGCDPTDLFLTPDAEIRQNASFRHFVVGPRGAQKASQAIILLHGLNERHWDKYLPMAVHLARALGKSVLLFPTAFHMNRSPALWTDPKAMRAVSQWRKSRHPDVLESSLSNAAISLRLQADPSRFFWSGLQTHDDITALVKTIRQGLHPAFAADATVDFFTYSIGCFIGEILFMADEPGLFADSRLALFCGGPIFSRMRATSKFIIDSKADDSLSAFLLQDLADLPRLGQKDPPLAQALTETAAGRAFLSMITPESHGHHRDSRLRALAGRVMAVGLAKDTVVPPNEIVATLQEGPFGRSKPGIEVTVADPPYPYRHEDPFPALAKHEAPVDSAFNGIMAQVCRFLA